MPDIQLNKKRGPTAEQLARATGQARELPVPPPAAPAPVSSLMEGRPPLPTAAVATLPRAKISTMDAPVGLTDLEAETLQSLGLKPTDEIPPNLADIVATMQRSYRDEPVTLPIDPRTPPLKADIKTLHQLSATQLEEVQHIVQPVGGTLRDAVVAEAAAAKQRQAAEQAAQAQALAQQRQQANMDPSVQQAIKLAQQTGQSPPLGRVRVEPGADVSSIAGPAPAPTPPPAAAAPPAAAPSATEKPDSDTGVHAARTHCPHCAWPLEMEDIPEPEAKDKNAFLLATLGLQPFRRDYALLNGHLHIGLRTLTASELDQVFAYVSRQMLQGEITSHIGAEEKLSRIRLCLQLTHVRSHDGRLDCILPEGFTAETNPNARTHWKLPPDHEGPAFLGLAIVDDYIQTEVLRTESLFRIAVLAANRFNRLTAKLEAMVDSPDFWPEIGTGR